VREGHRGPGTRAERPAGDDGLLIGYVEADDLAAAQAGMAATDVNARWQAEMAPFFESLDGARPDEAMKPLTEVFPLA
jgi:L-rhamnose mutarotase